MPAADRPKRKPGLLLGLIILLALGFASLLITLVNAATGRSASEADTITLASETAFIASDADDERPSPAGLSEWIYKLGDGFDGKVGIAVHSLEEDWTAAYRGGSIFPQQSVSKLWVAIAVLDAVDKGQISLTEQITVNRSDLTVFNQPIRERLGSNGYKVSVAELLKLSISQSDNTANDILFRKVGGQKAVAQMLARKKLDEIKVGPGEKALQSQIAGLEWRDEYSTGRAFWTARESVPMEARQEALKEYLGNPADAATPDGMVRALAKLQDGELLTPKSTTFLLNLMLNSTTGTERLRGGLASGWTLAHKTGTGQVLGPMVTAFNDVGILKSPDGKHYAVAVLVASTERSLKERQSIMSTVTKAVIECHGDKRWRCQ